MLEGVAAWRLPALAGLFLLLAAAEGLRPGAAGAAEAAARWGVNLGCWLLGAWAVAWLPNGWAGGLAGGQPFTWLETVAGPSVALGVGLLGLDLFIYGVHRLFHTAPLWPIHAVHHADLRVDASTALRHHPFETVGVALMAGALFALFGAAGMAARAVRRRGARLGTGAACGAAVAGLAGAAAPSRPDDRRAAPYASQRGRAAPRH